MQEVEVKILEVDRAEIIKKLEKLGAKKVFEGDLCAFYYDFPDHHLSTGSKILRLRTRGKEYSELTFKKKLSKEKAKIMEEHEITFTGDVRTIKEILFGIGLQEFRQIKKHRVSYSLGDVHFELDKMPDIPLFLEIEANSLDRIQETVELLGFTMKKAKPWSAREVLEHYSKHNVNRR